MEIMIVNQWWDFGEIGCDDGMKVNANSTYDPPCFSDGKQVVYSMSYSSDCYGQNFGCLAALLIGFRLIAYICLAIRVNGLPKCGKKSSADDKKPAVADIEMK